MLSGALDRQLSCLYTTSLASPITIKLISTFNVQYSTVGQGNKQYHVEEGKERLEGGVKGRGSSDGQLSIEEAHDVRCPACGTTYSPMLTITCYKLSKKDKKEEKGKKEEGAVGEEVNALEVVWTQKCRHLSPYGCTTKMEEVMHAIGRRAVDERRLCAHGRTTNSEIGLGEMVRDMMRINSLCLCYGKYYTLYSCCCHIQFLLVRQEAVVFFYHAP